MSMGYHILPYQATTAAAVTLQDLTAITDPVITQRNNHFTLTDDFDLIGAYAGSANGTEAVIKSPTWNAQTIFNIDPMELSATHLNPPKFMPFWDVKPRLAQDEEIQVQISDSNAAGNDLTGALFIAPPGWSQNIPKGIGPLAVFCAKVTVTMALVANGWSALSTLTFEQSLRAGWYSLVGAKCYAAGGLFFRVLFPRSTLYKGRALRPGDLVSQAYGDQAWYNIHHYLSPWGEWGRFHTFELPQVEIYSGAAAASATYNLRLFLVKINDSTDPSFGGP